MWLYLIIPGNFVLLSSFPFRRSSCLRSAIPFNSAAERSIYSASGRSEFTNDLCKFDCLSFSERSSSSCCDVPLLVICDLFRNAAECVETKLLRERQLTPVAPTKSHLDYVHWADDGRRSTRGLVFHRLMVFSRGKSASTWSVLLHFRDSSLIILFISIVFGPLNGLYVITLEWEREMEGNSWKATKTIPKVDF